MDPGIYGPVFGPGGNGGQGNMIGGYGYGTVVKTYPPSTPSAQQGGQQHGSGSQQTSSSKGGSQNRGSAQQ